MQDVYLLLGSNIGKREYYLLRAVDRIRDRLGEVIQISSFYQTASWGIPDQPEFLNMAVFLKTDITAAGVLRITQEIEKELGRKREVKWGSRTIDIDILFYGEKIIDEPDLKIPHPLFHERRFAIEPMLELNSDFVHPVLRKSVKVLASELTDDLFVERITILE